MYRKLSCLLSLILVLCLSSGATLGGIAYPDPAGGWTYIYTGDMGAGGANFTALDGTWDHDNSGDAWDESEIGSGRPGGVSVLTEGDVTYLRLQETGDPRDYDMPDPSNRKIFFSHSITNDIGDAAATLLDDGVTMTFRARIPTTGPLDDLHPDGGGGIRPWPAGGNGYLGHHTGKDLFGIHQSGDTAKISFALSLASDSDFLEGKQGLTMNSLDGPIPSALVDIEDEDGTLNILELDPTVWHEFWIVIETDATEIGTHIATIYVDGDISSPSVFHVTAGVGDNEYDDSYFGLGVGSTLQDGAFDVDFYGYKEGAIHPPGARVKAQYPSPPNGVIVEERTLNLDWSPGEAAVSHDIYFSENFEDVNNSTAFVGNQTETSYGPLNLEFHKTYYWRIDEVNAANPDSPWIGSTWSFTAADYIVLDDFEDYNDYAPDRIFDKWTDGYNTTTNGSTVGYAEPDFSAGEHFIETDIFRNGEQSMPFFYDNDMRYSEAVRPVEPMSDWTVDGFQSLSLWFRGYPGSVGSFTEEPAGTYTMTGSGTDIWEESDEFHFAYKQFTGAGSIVARIESVGQTHEWAKAGVMIRNTLEPDSRHAMAVVTPLQGVSFQRRTVRGSASAETTEANITAPQWVKLERDISGTFTGYYSPNGNSWIRIDSDPITMSSTTYIGLVVTSHDAGATCEAVFSDVSITGNVTGQWTNQDIGIISNSPQPLYVTVANNTGEPGVVYHEDPAASQIDDWTEFKINLQLFEDQGVDLTDVNTIAIGFGDRNNPQPGGSGILYFDDIRLYVPPLEPEPTP